MLLIFAHILGDSVSRSEIAGRLEKEETSDSFRQVDERSHSNASPAVMMICECVCHGSDINPCYAHSHAFLLTPS
jgi:hypothetical protein